MSQLFTPYTLPSPRGGLVLPNRIVVAPMCQYQAVDGEATDWHLMHWGNLLNSGAGLFTIEATGVLPEGRITPACLGLWDDRTEAALADKLHRARKLAPHTAVCVQLAHAGRKASTQRPWEHHGAQIAPDAPHGWQTVSASPLAYSEGQHPPQALDQAGIDAVVAAFADSARRAVRLGLQLIEIHAAHGYLLHQFLSPLSNQRRDEYGSSFENRIRLTLQVVEAVRKVWPPELPLFVRVSATDWVEDGWNPDETVELARRLRGLGVDLIDVSSGGTSVNAEIPTGPGYQTRFAERVRKESEIATGTVGMITEPAQAEHILRTGQADIIFLARELLRDPYWPLHADDDLGGNKATWPAQYQRATSRANPIHESDLRD